MARQIKAIAFDYFGVISLNALKTYSDEATYKIIRPWIQETSSGAVSWPDFIRRLSRKCGLDGYKLAELCKLNPRVVDLIQRLGKDYRIGLLTNANAEFITMQLAKYHLRELFDVIVVSSEIGILKPDPRIYQHFIKQIGFSADQILFIDDSLTNVEAARALRMPAIRYESEEALVDALQKLGVNL